MVANLFQPDQKKFNSALLVYRHHVKPYLNKLTDKEVAAETDTAKAKLMKVTAYLQNDNFFPMIAEYALIDWRKSPTNDAEEMNLLIRRTYQRILAENISGAIVLPDNIYNDARLDILKIDK